MMASIIGTFHKMFKVSRFDSAGCCGESLCTGILNSQMQHPRSINSQVNQVALLVSVKRNNETTVFGVATNVLAKGLVAAP